jgi:hypothetical protein
MKYMNISGTNLGVCFVGSVVARQRKNYLCVVRTCNTGLVVSSIVIPSGVLKKREKFIRYWNSW